MSVFELAVIVLLTLTFAGVAVLIFIVDAIHRDMWGIEVDNMKRRERGEQ